MSTRGYIGESKTARQASRKPISATDGVLGIIMMLSYLAGGKNLFPAGTDPFVFLEGIEHVPGHGKAAFLDDSLLSGLCESMSDVLDRKIKSVSSGSLKVYLSNVRNGNYPNGGGVCPTFLTAYNSSGEMVVYPRDWLADVTSGAWEETPHWLREMVATQGV